MTTVDDTHAKRISGYSTPLLLFIHGDLVERHALKPKTHENRWIIHRLNAVRAELRLRRKAQRQAARD